VIVPETVCPKEIDMSAGGWTLKPLAIGTVPTWVLTATVRRPSAAPAAMLMEIPRLVGPEETIDAVTPVPLNVTPVAPPSPGAKMVAGTVAPGPP